MPLGFNHLLKLKWFVYFRKCSIFKIYFVLYNAYVLIRKLSPCCIEFQVFFFHPSFLVPSPHQEHTSVFSYTLGKNLVFVSIIVAWLEAS